jgi:hypothetical protein
MRPLTVPGSYHNQRPKTTVARLIHVSAHDCMIRFARSNCGRVSFIAEGTL